MSVKIYHNPRCSKSRETLALLEEKRYSTNYRTLFTTTLLD